MKEMFSISAGADVAKISQTIASDVTNNTNIGSEKSFLSIMFEQIKESISILDNNSKAPLELDVSIEKIELDLSTKNEEKSIDNHLLDDILKVISLLKNSDAKITSFPSLSNKLTKLINNNNALKELRGVKDITQLLEISKKYDLGLENISVKKIDFKRLEKEFPDLAKSKFFDIQKKVEPKNDKKVLVNLKKEMELKPTIISLNNLEKQEIKIKKEPTLFEKIMSAPKKTEEKIRIVEQDLDSVKKIVKKDDLKIAVNDISKKQTSVIVEDGTKKSIKDIVKSDTKKLIKDIVKNIDNKQIDKGTKSVIEKNSDKIAEVVIKKQTSDIVKNIDNEQNNKMVKTSTQKPVNVISTNSPKENIQVVKNSNNKPKQELVKDVVVKINTKSGELNLNNNTLHAKTKESKSTLVDESKKEPNFGQKGMIESLLQGIKPNKNTAPQAFVSRQSDHETILTSKDEVKIESFSNKNEFKVDLKTQTIASKQLTQTREVFSNFAADFKEKLENYKPPFMRVQLALNPKGLGEVDVTIINRGNNLHVNISSSANTMSIFTQNQIEFKNSLISMGFENLEMNFSEHKEKQEQQNAKTPQRDSEFLEEEVSEEETSSIELVLPQYI